MNREMPIYQGAMPQAARVNLQGMPELGGVPGNGAAVDRAIAGVERAVGAWAELHDAGETQRVASKRRENREKMDLELEEAAAAPRDSEDALFRADGSLNRDRYDTIVDKYRQENQKIGASFLLRENQQQFDIGRDAEHEDIPLRAGKFVALKEIANTKEVFADNYRLAMEQGRYGDAKEIARQGGAAGVTTPSHAELLAFNAEKEWVRDEWKAMLESNPEELYDRLQSGVYDRVATPAEMAEVCKAIRRRREEREPVEFTKSFWSDPAAKGKKDGGPEFTGLYTFRECQWINAIGEGKGDLVKQEMEYAAIDEARAFDPTGDEERFRADFMRKWHEQFGLDESFCTRLLNQAGERRKRLGGVEIDLKRRLDDLEGRGLLCSASEVEAIDKRLEDDLDHVREQYRTLAGISDDDDDDKAREKLRRHLVGGHMQLARGKILERYDAWRDTEEGGKAAPVVQREKLRQIVKEVTGNDEKSLGNGEPLDVDYLTGRQAQGVRHGEWKRGRGQLYRWSWGKPVEEPYAVSTVGFDTEQRDLPAGVLVPKGMLGGAKAEDVVVEMTFDNKHFRRFRVVGTTDGKEPVMTYAVARQGGHDSGRRYNVQLRLRKGDTNALMLPEERALGEVPEAPEAAEEAVPVSDEYGSGLFPGDDGDLETLTDSTGRLRTARTKRSAKGAEFDRVKRSIAGK